MRTHFHRDVHFRLTVKALEKGFRRGLHPFLQYDLSPLVQDADAALFVAQIDSYISAGLPGRLFDILAHKLVSLIAPLGRAFYLRTAVYCMPLQEASLFIPSFLRACLPGNWGVPPTRGASGGSLPPRTGGR